MPKKKKTAAQRAAAAEAKEAKAIAAAPSSPADAYTSLQHRVREAQRDLTHGNREEAVLAVMARCLYHIDPECLAAPEGSYSSDSDDSDSDSDS